MCEWILLVIIYVGRRERDRQTDRQTDRQRERHRNREAERQRDGERECVCVRVCVLRGAVVYVKEEVNLLPRVPGPDSRSLLAFERRFLS